MHSKNLGLIPNDSIFFDEERDYLMSDIEKRCELCKYFEAINPRKIEGSGVVGECKYPFSTIPYCDKIERKPVASIKGADCRCFDMHGF